MTTQPTKRRTAIKVPWGKTWKVLNEPLSIVLISAIIVAGVGSYFTGRQSCYADVERDESRLLRLTSEITFRLGARNRFFLRVSKPSDISMEKYEAMIAAAYKFSDFKELTLGDIIREYGALAIRFNDLDATRFVMLVQSAELQAKKGGPLSLDLESDEYPHATETELNDTKAFLQRASGLSGVNEMVHLGGYAVGHCGASDLLARSLWPREPRWLDEQHEFYPGPMAPFARSIMRTPGGDPSLLSPPLGPMMKEQEIKSSPPKIEAPRPAPDAPSTSQ